MVVTRFVPGRPLTIDDATSLDDRDQATLAADLGGFLTELHSVAVTQALETAGIRTQHPRPQAETTALRDRFPRWVGEAQRPLIQSWCDYADKALQLNVPGEVFLHGDLHGFNLVLEPDRPRLRMVADWETSAWGDPAFDFRYLPGQVTSTPELFARTLESYELASERTIDIDRVLAWHIRTVLGDALWRSEAGVPLPDGRTPVQWIEDLRVRLDAVARWRLSRSSGR
jgi:aminoglycoside phosphotransferase (APT) family kinase protein